MRRIIRYSYLLLLMVSILNATVIYVPQDQPSIQAGIDSASVGDTVLVDTGTYVENINFNGKNIVVASHFLLTGDTSYISETIIDGNQDGSVAIFESGEDSNTTLSGFRIQNGSGTFADPEGDSYFRYYGGGIYCSGSSPVLSNLVINANSTKMGGGIYFDNSNSRIMNVTVSGNRADFGGGILFYSSGPIVVNATITGNEARYDGGGIFCWNNSSPVLVNVTISDNIALLQQGYGIYCHTNSNPILVNTIVWNVSPEEIYFNHSGSPNSVTVAYSGVFGGREGIKTNNNGNVYWLSGNISDYPFFVDSENGDYHLMDYSPCIGAGTGSVQIEGTWYYAPNNDIEGKTRPDPDGSKPDLGAHESPLGTPTEYQNQVFHVSVSGSDETGDGSQTQPFASVQKGINVAIDGDIVLADTGTYVENINFKGRNIVVASYFLLTGDTSYISQTVIEGYSGRVVTFENGENLNAKLNGFTITKGRGGIVCSSSSPTLRNLIITRNRASYGGGIWVFASSPRIENVIISGNTSSGSGGGIYCTGKATPTLHNVIISGNSATGAYAVGGGIASMSSSPSLAKVTIIGNRVSDYGGGIAAYDNSNVSLTNVTISRNTAGYRGGAIHLDGSDTYPDVTLVNTILWNDSPDEISTFGGSVSARYSDIQAGWQGTGNIDVDPLFVDAANNDFQLIEGSPCIDAGTDVGLPFLGDAPDIGAFESVPDIITVYPGDTDNNGVVNARDVLPIGIYFLLEGNPRDAVTASWSPLQASTWQVWTATYADANGDGVVDEKDVIAIGVNWGNTHAYSLASLTIDPANTALLHQHRKAFQEIYNSLSGEGEAVIAMKTLLRSILRIETPQVFSLQQNYPNPFNPRTTIRFVLPEAQPVTLTVYNIRGQVVFMLVDNKMYDVGTHTIEFDASRFSSGVYFYRIQAGKWSAIRKMIVVK